ncbi:baculoviral IAP repeat-containing protein 3-like [Haliotis rubra]|uniref:baculoviral IAP repeat-containing protein 3-like n=1 Tax=Haliotis rubra TaxID=36100 RepID=UPI001EE5D0C6|nr:baculoviral IAP repeat-containing protein 3-like [Haliotis rubra]
MTMAKGVGNLADTQSGNISTQLECVDCMDDDFETLAKCSRVMKYERNRRETFKTWPAWSCQRPECLAKAGFYYTKISDRVQCPFCFGVLKKWETWDEPMSEHRRHFPHCKFIQGEDVGNVPLEDNTGLFQHPIAPVCVGSENRANVDFKKAVNRLASFSRWPPNLTQTPEVLARAGFYHVPCEEKPDRVRCAYCQGKLYNWKPEDDPWIEHAKCFPSCPYVKLCMGQDTIVDMLHEQRVVEEKNTPESLKDQQSSAQENISSPEDNMTELTRSEAVLAVLQMGFSQQLVQEVLRNNSKSSKGKCFSAQELATDILDMEKALETTNIKSKTSASTERTQCNRTQPSKTDTRGMCGLQNNSTSNNSPVLENIMDENSRIKDRYLCKICMESPVRVTFMPCGHLACCGPCSMAVSSCPICRNTIQGRVRTYF